MKYPRIQKSKEVLDIVIGKLSKDPKKRDPYYFVNEFQNSIVDRYLYIYNSLPDYSKMNEYYLLMCKNIVPEATMEKHKNHYLATIRIINQLAEKFKRYISKNKKMAEKNRFQKEFLGRASSVIRKLDKTIVELLGYSKDFKRIPNPDQKQYTVVLIGVPNSGKTTLLAQITDANPEINRYSFTTKSLNLGYFKKRLEIIQVVDTPGLIHTEFKDMNLIEKQAIVAIKTLANVIVFLYNQYQSLEDQERILSKIKKDNPDKKMFVLPSFGGKMPKQKNITIKNILNRDL